MEPLLTEIDALREVLFTPVESFVTEKERAEKGEEWAEKTAHKRMFSQAIKAVDKVRGERTLYLATVGFGPKWIESFGPHPTRAQAQKHLDEIRYQLGDLVVRASVTTVKGLSGWESMLARTEKPAGQTGDWALVAEDARLFRKGWKGAVKDRGKFEESA